MLLTSLILYFIIGSKVVQIQEFLCKHYMNIKNNERLCIESKHNSMLRQYSSHQSSNLTATKAISNFYRSHFNSVDLMDRFWYNIIWEHRTMDWRVHFSWALIHVAVINAWVSYCEIVGPKSKTKRKPISLLSYIKALSLAIGHIVNNYKKTKILNLTYVDTIKEMKNLENSLKFKKKIW